MALVGVSWVGLVVLLGLGGGMGLPLGIPPAEEDPVMAAVAPEECLFYFTWSGTAQPDPHSNNETERLLAEQEIQDFISNLEERIVAAMETAAAREGPEAEALLKDAVEWAKLALTQSGALFVSKVSLGPDRPDVQAGAVLKVGDAAARVKARLETMLPQGAVQPVRVDDHSWYRIKLDDNAPSVTWGTWGEYLVVGLGDGSAEGIVERAQTEPPAWLADVRGRLALERMSTVSYVNLGAIRDMLAPLGGPRAIALINSLGLANVTALASTTGLDGEGFVGKTLLAIDGQPTGLLGLAGEPLRVEDLAPIPADATVALAARASASETFETIVSIISTIEPRARGELEQGLAEMTQQTGIDLRSDVLRPLGDVWCLYNSPSEGGLVLTGLTAVVEVADPARMAETQRKLQAVLEAMTQARGGRRGPSIDEFQFAGRDVYVLNAGEPEFPLAPSWCLTDRHLVVSLFPQNVKAFLSRGDDFQSLAQVPEVAQLLNTAPGPFKFAYVDTREIFQLAYPVVQMFAQVATSQLRREGIELGVGLLPSAASIGKHLRPGLVAARRTAAGFEVVTRQTYPGGNALAAMPMLAWWTGVRSSGPIRIGPIGGRTRSMNNMKQIGLALHNYHDVYKSFPPGYSTDDQDNPLLSWRVHILPFVEQQALYDQFRMDEPWDSEHNRQLIARMPEAYRSPAGTREPGKTNYLGVSGQKGVFPGPDEVRISDIRDGTSNTIMVVEADDDSAVIWTSPGDYQPDPDNPGGGLTGLWPGGFLGGFTDGSVRLISPSLDADLLMYLFQRDDGHPIPHEAIRGDR